MKSKFENFLEKYLIEITIVIIMVSGIFLLWQLGTSPTITENCERLCSNITGYSYEDNSYEDNQTVFYACLNGCLNDGHDGQN